MYSSAASEMLNPRILRFRLKSETLLQRLCRFLDDSSLCSVYVSLGGCVNPRSGLSLVAVRVSSNLLGGAVERINHPLTQWAPKRRLRTAKNEHLPCPFALSNRWSSEGPWSMSVFTSSGHPSIVISGTITILILVSWVRSSCNKVFEPKRINFKFKFIIVPFIPVAKLFVSLSCSSSAFPPRPRDL